MQHCAHLFAVAVPLALAATATQANVVISSGVTQNMNCANGICAPTAKDAVLNGGDLETMLASGNVSVKTTGSGVQANSIDVKTALSWSIASGLTLDAYQSISFSAAVQDGGTGGVSLVTNDGGSGGTLSFAQKGKLNFSQLAVNLAIDGAPYILVDSIRKLSRELAHNPGANFALANDYDAQVDGTYSDSPITADLNGYFNGLGHTISHVRVKNKSTNYQYVVGGLFAFVNQQANVSSVSISGSLVQANASAGGLVGTNEGTIFNSHARVTVRGGRISEAIGGLVAYNLTDATIANSWATVTAGGDKTNGGTAIGGLVGWDNGNIDSSFATGSIMAGASNVTGDFGGLIGYDTYPGSTSNSYAMVAVAGGANMYIGGFDGENDANTVSNSYSTGQVSAGAGSTIGGFNGCNSGSISGSYWDTDTSGTDVGSGCFDSGLTGLTTQQFQSGLPAGFDPAIWAEDASINNGFPYLIANPPPK